MSIDSSVITRYATVIDRCLQCLMIEHKVYNITTKVMRVADPVNNKDNICALALLYIVMCMQLAMYSAIHLITMQTTCIQYIL